MTEGARAIVCVFTWSALSRLIKLGRKVRRTHCRATTSSLRTSGDPSSTQDCSSFKAIVCTRQNIVVIRKKKLFISMNIYRDWVRR
jgi:hypothetical protein